MKYVKRYSLIFFAFTLLFISIPVESFAVDPVSAATMANAFAQAITAYGAEQGVSMMFDVTNTDGIGEGMHDLWERCKDDLDGQGIVIPSYSSSAVTVWSSLYKKVGDYVAINLDSEMVQYLDRFWNWLLSGPAEMTKVDNQYYEWQLNQSGNVDPIVVSSASFFGGIPLYSYLTAVSSNGSRSYSFTAHDCYLLFLDDSNNSRYTIGAINFSDNHDVGSYDYYDVNNDSLITFYSLAWNGNYNVIVSGPQLQYSYNYTLSQSVDLSRSAFESLISDSSAVYSASSVSVAPYVGDAVPQDVFIPDNDDVNYEPLPFVGPLDITWSDAWGVGETLSDAQSESIASSLNAVITDTGTLQLADTANPSVPSPSDTFHSVLPFVDLPSFDFNLSGIWHYVRDWVASLGAWFTLTFQIWQNLPYAIVVPVYATAVVLIVLGVYKRFFM